MREKTFGTILANIWKTISMHGWVYCSNERVKPLLLMHGFKVFVQVFVPVKKVSKMIFIIMAK